MIGVSGSFGNLRFPNPAEATGLYNSNSAAGSAFYSRSLRDKYQVGVNYQYQNFGSYPASTQSDTSIHTQTQTVFLFLTINLKPTLSLSFSAGPQHYTATQSPFPVVQSWSPLTMASVSWQGERTSLAASYSRIVTSAGGLNGTFQSNSASATARWQVSRTWSTGISASYQVYKNLTPSFTVSSPGGHSLLGTVSVTHSLGEHLSAQGGYSWGRQNYSGSTVISNLPDTNRVFVSLSYQFTRPLQ